MRALLATLMLCLLASCDMTPAFAKPHHHSAKHHRHHHHRVTDRLPPVAVTAPIDGFFDRQLVASLPPAEKYRLIGGRKLWQPLSHQIVSSGGGGDLLSRARNYMGTNPTGWARVWCARFMAMIAPEAARRIGNPNYARNWASLPHTSPHVGAVAVLARRGGGHVGVVSGFDASGNPIIVSGNHNHRVGEGVYSSRRVLAYVDAS